MDASGFLYQEVRKAKERLERALVRGDAASAARHARRVSELLRELARVGLWDKEELLSLAEEYERLAAQLSRGQLPTGRGGPPLGPLQPQAGGGGAGQGRELDAEFDVQAESLIMRANVTWDDIAGLEEVKRSLMEALFYSLARPEQPGVKVEPPRRFLLYGPPGTGKTMLAMAASNMLKATFIYVSVDRVLSRYVGDSPRMVSAIFRLAYRRAPSVVFFDEVEALTMRRDSGHEAATGLVQTLLTELDGFKSKASDKPVIVMAATNKPWLLDEAILSRFEKRIYVPLPDEKAREAIFKLHLEKRGFKIEGITYRELARLTEGYSGRDIANACREAIMAMLRRANPDIYTKLTSLKSASQLAQMRYRVEPITRRELLEAIEKVKPPISREEIARYEEWARTH